MKKYILQNSTFASEKTMDIVVNELKQVLISHNFDLENLHVESGETSINFIKDDIVIRLTYIRYDSWGYTGISDYVSHSDAILQPIKEKKVNTGQLNYPSILELKRLKVGDVTEKERNSIYKKLRDDGYLFNDSNKLSNFGRDENDKVYLIDYGELIYIKDEKKLNSESLFDQVQYKKFVERELKYHINVCSKLNKIYEEAYRNKKKKKLINLKSFFMSLKNKTNTSEEKRRK